jgi:Skp family chaperone for outer membrane proteins
LEQASKKKQGTPNFMNKTYWTGFLSGTSVLAIGMVALLAGSGFQGANQKIGVIDSNSVMQAIALAKSMVEDEKNLKTDRETVMAFLQKYPVIKKEDAEKFKTLSIKPKKTDAEKADLEKVKNVAQDAVKKFKEIELKSSPSTDELKQLDEFRNRKNEMDEYLQSLYKEFQAELAGIHDKNQGVVYDAFKSGINEVGKKQAYTLVLDKNIAPFGANDITEEVSKASAKK